MFVIGVVSTSLATSPRVAMEFPSSTRRWSPVAVVTISCS